MANVIRPIMENGKVLNKEFKAAMDSFKGSDGSVVPAQPDRYVVKVISSYKFTKEEGYERPTILDYKVDKETFDRLTYGTDVQVVYEMSTAGSNKPVSLSIIAK